MKQTCSSGSDTLNVNPDGIGERPQDVQDRVSKAELEFPNYPASVTPEDKPVTSATRNPKIGTQRPKPLHAKCHALNPLNPD